MKKYNPEMDRIKNEMKVDYFPPMSRRKFLSASGLAGLGLMLKFSPLKAATTPDRPYRRFEDVMRNKFTWDKVARGTHGTNCAGNCAFNVFVKDGIVWREEQQGEYESTDDTPDYGPRGCQKGLRHAKYMYGNQRILYPMKRVGKRGEGKWERVSWDQALTEIADKFIDVVEKEGPESISWGSGTQMSVKMASYAALARLVNITGVTVPEFYSGVGDLPTGVYTTLGKVYVGDTMSDIYKSKCVLVWMSNPAVTRIPDAHFFWEAKYNGTKVISISPEFTPTAMHSSLWVNPKPGTDAALAMGMVHTIIDEKLVNQEYIKEQSDLPFLVRMDTKKFLRKEDTSIVSTLAVEDNIFYLWDKKTNQAVIAPGTGLTDPPPGRDRRKYGTIDLGNIDPVLEGRWTVSTLDGDVEVTTVFELLKDEAENFTPEKASEITGVSPEVIRQIARDFAQAQPAMIYAGYAACKWVHGDLLQRAFVLLLSLTGNIGPEGSGLQISNSPKVRGLMAFAFNGMGPATRMISATNWDYEQGNMKELTKNVYGEKLAEEWDEKYQKSIKEDWFPQYGKKGWKMGFFAGNNGANWRASGNKWRKDAFENLESIVAIVPDMGVTAHYADYILPVAHHYERADIMLQPRTPYVQILDAAVPPLGESKDDYTIVHDFAKMLEIRAKKRRMKVIRDNVDGKSVRRDFKRAYQQFTMDGKVKDVKDVIQFIINTTPGIPKMSFEELAAIGKVRVEGSNKTYYDKDAPYHSEIMESVNEKRPYETLTSRQQFYIDHDWFIEYGEQLPTHKEPLKIDGYPLRMMMGHARHGIHSMWRDDPLMLTLQRGEPDIYVNPDDAKIRGVKDGDKLRIFNSGGEFFAMAHISAGIQPGMTFMYHGWDPMMFKDRQNFSAVISTSGLIKPTSMAGDYGHLGYKVLAYAPNQTYKDFTCDFEKVQSA